MDPAKSRAATVPDADDPASPAVGKIREILVGNKMRELDSRLRQIEEKYADRLARLETAFLERLANNRQDTEQALARLCRAWKSRFDETERLRAQERVEFRQEIEKSFSQRLDELAAQVRALEKGLSTRKADRKELAGLFSELAARLRN